MRVPKKRVAQSATTTETSRLGGRRLVVTDKNSALNFLIDTGADVSTVPPTIADHSQRDLVSKLTAANNTPILTFGERHMDVNLGVKQTQPWKFVEVEVPCESFAHPYSVPVTVVNNNEHPFCDVIAMFQYMSSTGLLPVGSLSTHHIITKGPPVFARPRRLSPEKAAEEKKQLDELLALDIIRPSSSNWSSPIHLVPKTDGS